MHNKDTKIDLQRNSTRQPTLDYRIESEYAIDGPFLTSKPVTQVFMRDMSIAVVSAAKSKTVPAGHEIRVVHVPTGEVVFTKAAANHFALTD